MRRYTVMSLSKFDHVCIFFFFCSWGNKKYENTKPDSFPRRSLPFAYGTTNTTHTYALERRVQSVYLYGRLP